MDNKQKCGAIQSLDEFKKIVDFLLQNNVSNKEPITLIMSDSDYKATNEAIKGNISTIGHSSVIEPNKRAEIGEIDSLMYGGYKFVITTE